MVEIQVIPTQTLIKFREDIMFNQNIFSKMEGRILSFYAQQCYIAQELMELPEEKENNNEKKSFE